MKDRIIDKSDVQKRIRLELMKLEARPLGYVLVRSAWLSQMIKRLPPADRVEAMMESVR